MVVRLKFSAICVLMVLVQRNLKRWNFEIALSVQRFYSAMVVEKVARPNVQTIKAKSSQPNKSLNLTSPALRGGQRSGAVKRAPQVSSSPLARIPKKVL